MILFFVGATAGQPPTAPTCTRSGFQAVSMAPVGSFSATLISGDFNGDYRTDLVVGDGGGVTVLRGTGDGTFQVGTTFAKENGTKRIVVGDFNSDLLLDVVGIDAFYDEDLFFLPGNGQGSFGALKKFRITGTPETLVAGDFNGDQKLDLAILTTNINRNVFTLYFFSGDGQGNFTEGKSYGVEGRPTALTVADFNRDGRLDVAVAQAGLNSIAVLRNMGDGSFAASATLSVGSNPKVVITGDFNRDGVPDLATSNYDSHDVSVLLNNGSGQFQPTVNYTVKENPTHLAVGDFNADGKPDLVVPSVMTGYVTILIGDGTGVFGAPNYLVVGLTPVSVVCEDFDENGRDDLAVVTQNGSNAGGTISTMLFDSSNAPVLNGGYNSSLIRTTDPFPFSLDSADFDGDGKLDLVAANIRENSITFIPGNGQGGFGPTRLIRDVTFPYKVRAGDFNRDGKPDLVVLANLAYLYLGNGQGNFTIGGGFSLGTDCRFMVIGDLNSDGNPDVLGTNFNGNTVSVILGDGKGQFSPVVSYPAGTEPTFVVTGDVNRDGKLDVVVANQGAISLLLGDGTGKLSSPKNTPAERRVSGIALADFNGDGKLDIAAINNGGFGSNSLLDYVEVRLGDGLGNFGAPTRYKGHARPLAIAAADFNNDGKLDLALTNNDSKAVSILLGDGKGGFAEATHYLARNNPAELVVGDFNQDGRTDIATIDNAYFGGSVLLGTCADRNEPVTVSAASYLRGRVAAESIVSVFGTNLATTTQPAPSLPLPTELGGTTVRVKDSAGVERLAPLFFVSPLQVNYQIPAGTAPGVATVTLSNSGAQQIGTIQVVALRPSLFTANQNGQGVVAANVVRVRSDGTRSNGTTWQWDALQNQFVAQPIELGPDGDQVFLELYGTGLRLHPGLDRVRAWIGGTEVEVLYAGSQQTFAGLDQVNVRLPRSLQGRGEIGLVLLIAGKTSNTVRLSVR